MSKVIIVSHRQCPDGCASALAAYQKFGEEATYIPLAYGDPIPFEAFENNEVYVLDFSFNKEITEQVYKSAKSLQIIDHHLSAQKELKNLSYCFFDTNHSGAYLSWQFFNGSEVPEFIRYIEDRDLWRFQLPDSKEISAAIMSYGTNNFRDWQKFLETWEYGAERMWKQILIEEGKAILRQRKEWTETICNTSEVVEFDGYKCPVANATVLFSEVPARLLELYPDCKFAIGYFWCGKRQLYQLSFRSRGDFDVSEVAKQYGGGGHLAASGTTIQQLPWKKS